MSEQVQQWIRTLEAEWSAPDGFLWELRQGVFDQQKVDDFLETLRNINPPEDGSIDRRLVSLLWYIPVFLSWQTARVSETGAGKAALERLITQAQSCVEQVLGIP